jgi:hypothetical protein
MEHQSPDTSLHMFLRLCSNFIILLAAGQLKKTSWYNTWTFLMCSNITSKSTQITLQLFMWLFAHTYRHTGTTRQHHVIHRLFCKKNIAWTTGAPKEFCVLTWATQSPCRSPSPWGRTCCPWHAERGLASPSSTGTRCRNQKPVIQTNRKQLAADHKTGNFSPTKLGWEKERERGKRTDQ